MPFELPMRSLAQLLCDRELAVDGETREAKGGTEGCRVLPSVAASMNTTSPKSSLAKLGLHPKTKPFRVMVLGQSGVGKTAIHRSHKEKATDYRLHDCSSINIQTESSNETDARRFELHGSTPSYWRGKIDGTWTLMAKGTKPHNPRQFRDTTIGADPKPEIGST
ncbi:hypothetical protein AND_002220 [Anopheles darlingi]|uniref:Uncharacterized protein n=1 Tax=Anopheles darlingi TaxID=43151 RepID=W5JPG2_ANODA|nr:hypothetical protein AND_002220 [Anopheles darlingi]